MAQNHLLMFLGNFLYIAPTVESLKHMPKSSYVWKKKTVTKPDCSSSCVLSLFLKLTNKPSRVLHQTNPLLLKLVSERSIIFYLTFLQLYLIDWFIFYILIDTECRLKHLLRLIPGCIDWTTHKTTLWSPISWTMTRMDLSVRPFYLHQVQILWAFKLTFSLKKERHPKYGQS